MKPDEFYFQLCYNEPTEFSPDHFFTITPKAYFDAEGYLSDESGLADEALPIGFFEVMESTYEYEGDPLDGRNKLLEFGFTEINFNLGECEPYPGTENAGIYPKKPSGKKPSIKNKAKAKPQLDWDDDMDDVSKYSTMSNAELTKILIDVVAKEDFESASEIRDELNSRERK